MENAAPLDTQSEAHQVQHAATTSNDDAEVQILKDQVTLTSQVSIVQHETHTSKNVQTYRMI